MQTIEATFEIVTPMFIGGGNNDVELRPPSIKGALRFWWRALQWGACLQDSVNKEEALHLLHQRETDLFGGALDEKKKIGGQGAFLLKVNTKNIRTLTPIQLDTDNQYSLRISQWQTYLLGLGLMEYRQHANFYLRPALVSGSFTVALYCKNPAYLDELKNLLLLWGLLGGLGSRQRKGLGSISIKKLLVAQENIDLPNNKESVIDTLQELINRTATDEPPYTAFSEKSRILCSEPNNSTPWQQLADVAQTMQLFRGWGFKAPGAAIHRINGHDVNYDAHRHKTSDHAIVNQYGDATLPKQLPHSLSFGLPRAYKLANGNEFKLEATGTQRSRRASPVFIHVHRFFVNDRPSQSMIIQSFLPATFLPATDEVKIQQKAGRYWNDVASVNSSTVDWQVIDDYLALFNTWQVV